MRRADGHFAIVVRTAERLLAATDRVASHPMLYTTTPNLVVGGPGPAMRRFSQGRNADAALAIAMSGYSLGSATLHEGVHLMRPGDLLYADGGHVSIHRYWAYRPWLAPLKASSDELLESGADTMRRVMEKLAASLEGRPALIPLSGGLDSRLVAAGLRQMGHPDIRTFAYGLPGNHDAAISKTVAERLGVPWRWVPITYRTAARFFATDEHARYVESADTQACVPVEHELLALRLLSDQHPDFIDGAVMVNGQSGDYLAGNHIPALFADTPSPTSEDERRERVIDALSQKHYRLWSQLRTPERVARLRHLLWDDIAAVSDLPDDPGKDFGLYETSEWQNRQSRYVVGGQRVYDFLGLDWRLPLWDNELMDFFEQVPLQHKLGRALFRAMVEKANWGGVWGPELDRRWVSPRTLRTVRPVLRASVGGTRGKPAWKRFEQRWLSYWTDIEGKIAFVPYRRALSDQRGWRHAVSWLTEVYLNRHGLDWRGLPLDAADG